MKTYAQTADAIAIVRTLLRHHDESKLGEEALDRLLDAMTTLQHERDEAQRDSVAVRSKMHANATNLDAAIDAREAAEERVRVLEAELDRERQTVATLRSLALPLGDLQRAKAELAYGADHAVVVLEERVRVLEAALHEADMLDAWVSSLLLADARNTSLGLSAHLDGLEVRLEAYRALRALDADTPEEDA